MMLTLRATNYLNRLPAAVCKACWSGSFASKRGLPTCEIAQPGTFTNVAAAANATFNTATLIPTGLVKGAQAPTPCGMGYFQSSAETTTCTACAVGTYADQAGLAACKPCQPGRWVG